MGNDTNDRGDVPDDGWLVRCDELRIGYREPILPAIDLEIRPGEIWAVIGRNGSGKTTWFRTVLGLTPSLGGRIERRPGLRVSYVPQRSHFDALFPLLSRDVVRMGLERNSGFLMPSLREPPGVMEALRTAGAAELADRPFRDLSEGQKQRVLIARLAASRPQLALLDEPTAAMDVVAEREAFAFLDALRRDTGASVVIVSHYLGVAREVADRALFVDREGGMVVVGPPDQVLGHRAFRTSFGDIDLDDACSHG